jgi:nucleoside-diphosphate-sugar epimerase
MRVLVAGITGQLGRGLAETAAGHGAELIPVVRRVGRRDARARLARLFPGQPELAERAIEGDVTAPFWGLSAGQIRRLAGTADVVLNVAGETNWAAPSRRLHAINVMGALHGQQLAGALGADGRPPLYCYASSIHAAGGDALGRVAEAPFPPSAKRTAYEQSKWLAERRLLDGSAPGAPAVVARIGGLVGNSCTGATARRNSLYMLADRWESLPARVLPTVRRGRVDMLPRDDAARLLLTMLARLEAERPDRPVIAHVCAGEAAPTAEALIAAIRSLGDGGAALRTLPVPPRALVWASSNLDRVLRISDPERNLLVGLRYMALDRVFERATLASLLDSPLPRPTAEQLARLAFEAPAAAPEPVGPDRAMARFAG